MPGTSSESSETYRLSSYLIIMSEGLLCDEDFDLDEHLRVTRVCGWSPRSPEDIKAMNMTCLGKRLPPEMMERIDQRYDELPKNVREELI